MIRTVETHHQYQFEDEINELLPDWQILSINSGVAHYPGEDSGVIYSAILKKIVDYSDFKNKRFDEIELTIRTSNALRLMGISKVKDLCDFTYTEIKNNSTVGKKSLIELCEFMQNNNLEWKKETE